MEDNNSKFKIIENTKDGRNSFGHLYGSEIYTITESDIIALKNGKQIASTVCDEYSIFIELEKNE